jgi:MFS transporter, putative metabolite:H+ symporter
LTKTAVKEQRAPQKNAVLGNQMDTLPAQTLGSATASDLVLARFERIPLTRAHRRIASILSLGLFFDAYDLLAIAVVLPIIFRALHIDLITTGLLISLGYVGHLIGVVFFGIVSELRSRKVALIGALAVMGLFSLASAFAWNFSSLAVFRLLCGVGLGAVLPISSAMISELVQSKNRGRISLLYEASFSLGTFLTPLIGFGLISLLGPDAGWRWILAIGGLPLLLAIKGHFLIPESVRWLIDKGRLAEAEAIVTEFERAVKNEGHTLPELKVRVHADVQPTKFGELFHLDYRRRTFLCWSQWFFCYIAVSGFTSWLPSFFNRVAQLSLGQSLLATVAVSGCGVIMVYVTGLFFIDRLGRVVVFSIAFAGAAFGAGFGLLFQNWGWYMLLIAACIAQGFSYINAQGCFVYTPELYPTRMRAWATSAGRGCALVAGVIAPITVGFLLANYGVTGMFALFTVVSLAGMAMMLLMGIETKGKTLEELSH